MNKVIIIISIRPEHVANILNGDKTLELRKSLPKDIDKIIKEQGGIWVHIYVTTALPFLAYQVVAYDDIMGYPTAAYFYGTENEIDGFEQPIDSSELLNGKIVARFWFDEYDKYYFNTYQGDYRLITKLKNIGILSNELIPLNNLCLGMDKVLEYGRGKNLYVWNIKQLEIFDVPKELRDFYTYKKRFIDCGRDCPPYWDEVKTPVIKAPQSWQYAYINERRQA